MFPVETTFLAIASTGGLVGVVPLGWLLEFSESEEKPAESSIDDCSQDDADKDQSQDPLQDRCDSSD